jgi:type I restriction enzyme M protein
VDVIMTNPPFGGEEERGILSNFPDDKQTAETALLFLQLIMRKLRRQPKAGRAGVVVPNGVLSASGVAFRIRQELLNGFNLRVVVRLPHNVFAPYTDVTTNILFFDRSGATKDILFCELELPPGFNLSKTKPLDFARLKPLLAAIAARQESPLSWLVKVDDLGPTLDLDRKNPRLKLDNLASVDSCFLDLQDQLRRAAEKVESLLRRLCNVRDSMRSMDWVPLGSLTVESDERIGADYTAETKLIGVTNTEGITQPKGLIGKSSSKYKRVQIGYLAYNPMRINIGSIGVALSDEDTGITSPDYVVFRCKEGLDPEYVYHFLRSEAGRHAIKQKTRGSVRFRLYYDKLAGIRIPTPKDPSAQSEFARLCREVFQIRGQVVTAGQVAADCLSALTQEILANGLTAMTVHETTGCGPLGSVVDCAIRIFTMRQLQSIHGGGEHA